METVDVIVLGLGPGGEDVAGRLAEAGLDVVGIEAELVGGECPYWGCVPSKMMIRAADALAEARRVDGLAGHATVTPDWAPVAQRIRAEATDSWDDTVAADRFTGKGGRLVRGRGRIVGPRSVEVAGTTYVASRALVVNTGSAPAIPPIPGLADTPYWTNRGAIQADEVPASLVVLGGGAIGLELAQAFARFGAAVTVIEAADRVLATEEPEATAVVSAALISDGVDLRAGVRALGVSHDGAMFSITTDSGEVRGERLLVATGRRSDLPAFGADALGVAADATVLPTDERCRVADGVYAIGDVTGHGAFTHVSMYQADIVVRDILGDNPYDASYIAVPRVTFTDPEVGAVGLTEAQARESGLDVRVSSVDLATSARGWIARASGVVKLVADGDVLVGGTVVGPSGGEVMSALAVAVAARYPVADLKHQIWAYPTFHRGIGDALRDL
jgi:pyruvate/2-oxoglutarate dehydrogenase complex dihydrolipoamide dehydrogenase (E3) component